MLHILYFSCLAGCDNVSILEAIWCSVALVSARKINGDPCFESFGRAIDTVGRTWSCIPDQISTLNIPFQSKSTVTRAGEKNRRAVMVVSYQPLIGCRGPEVLNSSGHPAQQAFLICIVIVVISGTVGFLLSFSDQNRNECAGILSPHVCCSLWSLPKCTWAEKTLDTLHTALVEDFMSLYENGFTVLALHASILGFRVSALLFVKMGVGRVVKHCGLHGQTQRVCSRFEVQWHGKSYKFRVFPICIKGDWPFLRKAGHLGPGFNALRKCHLCTGEDSRLTYVIISVHFKKILQHYFLPGS